MARKLSHISSKITGYLSSYYHSKKIHSGEVIVNSDGIVLPKAMKIAFK
ncbi:hypothetical protein CRYPA_1678 [uncultured Candidatus Thioglobus sp.]|nr:hypothetical protein CRYPA_1678 [uncultured Candidatus Thioglobus sp.]